jgi:epoxyqueuosine reductase QueG
MDITTDLKELLYAAGAELVGIADLTGVENCEYPVGVSVAIPLPPTIIEKVKVAPDQEYFEIYQDLNRRLDSIVAQGADFLIEKGFRSLALAKKLCFYDENNRTALPYKTVATLVGLGWIGKNCLLVTPEYGSAIRLSVLLTEAPLITDEPILTSGCENCDLCVTACPAAALHNTNWSAGMDRELIVDAKACEQKALQITEQELGFPVTICGKCFAVCLRTQKWLEL